MTTTTDTNGSGRKTLASQLDRLDKILDGLGEGLNEAVADAVQRAVEAAVRQAVGQAVHEAVGAVLSEVLTNPQLQDALRGTAAPAAPAAPPAQPGRKGLLGRALSSVRSGLGRLRGACASVVGRLSGLRPAGQLAWGLTRRYRVRLLAACGAGAMLAAGAYYAGPYAAAAAGWVSGFAASLAVQARAALRRLLAAPGNLT